MIVGPGGLEDRGDVWLGATLMAPNVRYPDHDHAPEETYLVLSDGEFLHGDSDWFSPGVGGTFYNPPPDQACDAISRKAILRVLGTSPRSTKPLSDIGH